MNSKDLVGINIFLRFDVVMLLGNKCRNIFRKLYVIIYNFRFVVDNRGSVKILCFFNIWVCGVKIKLNGIFFFVNIR